MKEETTYCWQVGSEQELDALAAGLAPLLQPGDVVALSGTLGAGKTRFVQGVARALGIVQPVTSPTFAILQTYEAALPLHHFDLYRLEDDAELEDIGFWETIEGDGASFIEWASKFSGSLPDDFVELDISVAGDNARALRACAHGPRAVQLLDAWAGLGA